MSIRLLCWGTYLAMMIVMGLLPMIAEWNDPILVDIKYNGSYWMYFWDFVFPFLFKFVAPSALVFGFWHWMLVRDMNYNQKKHDAIKDHFGIDYPEKD